MKKSLLALLAWSAFVAAQTGPQPLFISNVTFVPDGCLEDPATFTLKVTASGGTPNASGQYTYQLQGQADQIGTTAEFPDVPTDTLAVAVQDSAGNSVSYTISGQPSAAEAISLNIDSLPLGAGQGCITLNVDYEVEPLPTNVQFSIAPATENDPEVQTLTVEPYTKTFSAPASVSLKAVIGITDDCGDGDSEFAVTFKLPQGFGNTMKTYLFNKYCSCALQSSTVPVTP
jgi:VCBS repeat-containing protein